MDEDTNTAWAKGLPLRQKGTEFLISNGNGTAVKVEVGNLPATMEMNGPSIARVQLTGFVGKDDSIGVDSAKANFFEGNKGAAGLRNEPTPDSLLGMLGARLRERLGSSARIGVAEEELGSLSRRNGVYKYTASADIPAGMTATEIESTVRQELKEIHNELNPDTAFRKGVAGDPNNN